MRIAISIAGATILFLLVPEPEHASLWLAVAIAALALGGVAVNRPSTS